MINILLAVSASGLIICILLSAVNEKTRGTFLSRGIILFAVAIVSLATYSFFDALSYKTDTAGKSDAVIVETESLTTTTTRYLVVYVCGRCGVATEEEIDKCTYCGHDHVAKFSFFDNGERNSENNYGFRKRFWKYTLTTESTE